MASPQKENGYTAIANELLEAICKARFNGTQYKILLCVMRYTYGFHRKAHGLSITFISNSIGVSRRYVSAEIQRLIDQNVLAVLSKHTDTSSRVLAVNKNYNEWLTYGTIVQQVNDCSTDELEQHTTGEELFTTTGEELFTQERKNKTKLKESISKKSKIDLQQYDLSQSVIDVFAEFVEHRKQMKKPATQLSVKKIINMFQQNKYNDDEMILSLEKSIMNGYQGVCPLKNNERIYKEVEKPKEVLPQFESEEQRQAQMEHVARLLRSQPPAIDLERMLE